MVQLGKIYTEELTCIDLVLESETMDKSWNDMIYLNANKVKFVKNIKIQYENEKVQPTDEELKSNEVFLVNVRYDDTEVKFVVNLYSLFVIGVYKEIQDKNIVMGEGFNVIKYDKTEKNNFYLTKSKIKDVLKEYKNNMHVGEKMFKESDYQAMATMAFVISEAARFEFERYVIKRAFGLLDALEIMGIFTIAAKGDINYLCRMKHSELLDKYGKLRDNCNYTPCISVNDARDNIQKYVLKESERKNLREIGLLPQ